MFYVLNSVEARTDARAARILFQFFNSSAFGPFGMRGTISAHFNCKINGKIGIAKSLCILKSFV